LSRRILRKLVDFQKNLWIHRGAARVYLVVSTSYLTKAIVLHSRPFGESDKIVCFLTEGYGKVTGIAKGAKRSKRRFVNSLEPFSLVNLRFQDYPQRSLAFIHDCVLVRGFKRLTQNLDRIACASYVTEITGELVREREENGAIFHHLQEGLVYLDENEISAIFLTFFELKLLRLAGFDPMFEGCCRCKKKWQSGAGKWWFSHRDGGILCAACCDSRREIVALSEETLHVFVGFRAQERCPLDSSLADPKVVQESRFFLPRFIQFQINKPLKSVRFLDSFCTF